MPRRPECRLSWRPADAHNFKHSSQIVPIEGARVVPAETVRLRSGSRQCRLRENERIHRCRSPNVRHANLDENRSVRLPARCTNRKAIRCTFGGGGVDVSASFAGDFCTFSVAGSGAGDVPEAGADRALWKELGCAGRARTARGLCRAARACAVRDSLMLEPSGC